MLAARLTPPPVGAIGDVINFLGTSPSGLARALAHSPGVINDWLKGRRYPRPEHWMAIKALVLRTKRLSKKKRANYVEEMGAFREKNPGGPETLCYFDQELINIVVQLETGSELQRLRR